MPIPKQSKSQADVALRRLKGQFSEIELIACREIGADDSQDLRERVKSLFEELNDPLLSLFDILDLLNLPNKKVKVIEALEELKTLGYLESDTESTRPLFKDTRGADEELYRRKGVPFQALHLLAVETEAPAQNDRTAVERYFQFSCDGRLVRQIAKIQRFDALTGTGSQRDEIRKHIESISLGIASGVQIPNSILLVFDPERTLHTALAPDEGFDQTDVLKSGSALILRDDDSVYEMLNPTDPSSVPAQRVSTVELVLPYRRAAFNNEKVLTIADGQQRTAALAITSIDDVPEYMLTVNAVLATTPARAQEIFVTANKTQKIKTDFAKLIESVAVGENANESQWSTIVTHKLATAGTTSPFGGIIALPGTKVDKAVQVVAFLSVEVAVRETYEELVQQLEPNYTRDQLQEVVNRFFSLVKATWPNAWGLKPTASKLMSGLGLRSLSRWFISAAPDHAAKDSGQLLSSGFWREIEQQLQAMASYCVVWTNGDAAAGSQLHQKFFEQEIRDRGLVFQDITRLTNALRLAAKRTWNPRT